MNVVFSLSLLRVNSEFAIRFQISENVSIMLNFPVIHHFGKLTVNEGFCAVKSTLLSADEAVSTIFFNF